MMIHASQVDGAEAAAGAVESRAVDSSAQAWDRRENPDGPPTLDDEQRQAHEEMHAQMAHAQGVVIDMVQLGDDAPSAEAPAAEAQPGQPAPRGSWWGWTAALLTANAAQGGFETFVGRLAQEGVRVASGDPQRPEDVADKSMAVHAAINIGMGLVAGVRAGLHGYRAMGDRGAYARAFRGEPPTQASTFAAAGTPTVPSGMLARISASAAIGIAAFAAASHTGAIALAHLGGSSPYKADAYRAVVESNGQTAYCYGREVTNLASRALGLVSHDAPLTLPGAAISSAQYLANSMSQQAAQQYLGLRQGPGFDLRWPAISALAEAVDVDFIAGSARIASPERPVAMLRGRLSEAPGEAGRNQAGALSPKDAVDRLTQRAVGRQLVGEIARVVPKEIGAALRPVLGSGATTAASWVGAALATGTHLREPMWQAENQLVASARARRPT